MVQNTIQFSAILATLAILSIHLPLVQSQLILIDELDGSISNNSGIVKMITFNDQNNQDLSFDNQIAVFGWIKISPESNYGKIFTLSPLSEPNEISIEQQSQRQLFSLSFVPWNSLNLYFYSLTEDDEQLVNILIEREDLDTWIFFYIGHSYEYQQQTTYLKRGINEKVVTHKNYQQLPQLPIFQVSSGIGKLQNEVFFNGSISKLTLDFSKTAYRENGFEWINQLDPSNLPKCGMSFSEKAFTGESIDLCSFKGRSKKIKSVYVQKGKTVEICFKGSAVEVRKSIEDMDEAEDMLQGLVEYNNIVSSTPRECSN